MIFFILLYRGLYLLSSKHSRKHNKYIRDNPSKLGIFNLSGTKQQGAHYTLLQKQALYLIK